MDKLFELGISEDSLIFMLEQSKKLIETHIKSNCSVRVGFLILNGTHTHI